MGLRSIARTFAGSAGFGLLVAIRVAFVASSPVTIAGCACPASGAAVVLGPAVVAKTASVTVSGPACDPSNLVCMARDRDGDRCTTFWIDAKAGGACVFAVGLDDGSRVERTLTLEVDDAYPCRGNVRPQTDGVLRIDAP